MRFRIPVATVNNKLRAPPTLSQNDFDLLRPACVTLSSCFNVYSALKATARCTSQA